MEGKLNLFNATIAAAAVALLATLSDPAHARRGHHGRHVHHHHPRVAVILGAPVFPRWYFPPPVYYPVPAVPPPVYIEKGAEPQEPPPAYSYYCQESRAFYPEVRECRGGWKAYLSLPDPQPAAGR